MELGWNKRDKILKTSHSSSITRYVTALHRVWLTHRQHLWQEDCWWRNDAERQRAICTTMTEYSERPISVSLKTSTTSRSKWIYSIPNPLLDPLRRPQQKSWKLNPNQMPHFTSLRLTRSREVYSRTKIIHFQVKRSTRRALQTWWRFYPKRVPTFLISSSSKTPRKSYSRGTVQRSRHKSLFSCSNPRSLLLQGASPR